MSVGGDQVLTARKTRSQDSFGRSISSTSSTGAGGSSSRLTPPPQANLPTQQPHQAPPPPAPPQQPSYLDAITELQQVDQGVNCLKGLKPSSLKALQGHLRISCAVVINALGNNQQAQVCLATKGYKQAELRKHRITSKHFVLCQMGSSLFKVYHYKHPCCREAVKLADAV